MPRADGHLTNKEMSDVLQRLSEREESWDSPAMQQEWLKKYFGQEDFRRKYLSAEACEQMLRGKQIGKAARRIADSWRQMENGPCRSFPSRRRPPKIAVVG